MKSRAPVSGFASFLLVAVNALAAPPADWPGWRGPQGDGKLPMDTAFPRKWSPSSGIVWKTPLPAPGNSSPVIAGGRVLVTFAEDRGHRRSTLCFDASSGSEVWRASADYPEEEPSHQTNHWTSATPATDGNAVYVWHGSAGFFAYALQDGKLLWKRDLGRFEHQWGANAASPVLFKSAILLHAGPGNRAMLLALRKSDGQTIWETSLPDAVSADPKEFKGSWSTPVLRDNAGQTEMIVAHPRRLTGYDPITGKELWRCEGLSDLCYADPLVSGGYAVSMSGYGGPTLGMKLPSPGQTGNLTASHRLWVADRNPQRIGSGVMIGDLVYLCNEPGAMECIEAATGRSRWKERLGKNTWASAVYAGGLIYVTDQSATTFVIEPSPDRLIKVAENTIGSAEFTNSTPAFADGAIFLRTHSALYRIGN